MPSLTAELPTAGGANLNSNDYHIIAPPATVAAIAPDLVWSPAVVDYTAHPAYAQLIKSATFGTKLRANTIFAVSMARQLVKRLIRYELIPGEIRNGTGMSGKARFAVAALKSAVNRAPPPPPLADASALHQKLEANGVAVVSIPSSDFFRLESAVQPFFDALEARRRQTTAEAGRAFDDSRSSANRVEAPELFAVIEDILVASGVMAAVSAYTGRACKLVDANPQINDPSDSFWRDIFPDLSLGALPKTAYFHRDASGGDLKAIFYMTDVGPDNGPFSYSLGTHKIGLGRVDDLICEANDTNGLSATDPQSRALFAALPAKLRQKGSYGNDLADSAAFSQAIEPSVWSITASKGSIVLFDTKGTHRGGMVEAGERRVVTCILG